MEEPTPRPTPPSTAPAPRAPRVSGPAPSPRASRLKRHLVVGIISTSLVLCGLIAFRLWQKFKKAEPVVVDVRERWESAFNRASAAGRDILEIEGRAWKTDQPLSAEDLARIRASLQTLEASEDELRGLLELLRQKRQGESQEQADIMPKWVRVKLWIVDAADLLDSEAQAPRYGGLFVPMHRALSRLEKAQNELKELEQAKGTILEGSEPGRKENAIARLRAIESTLAACGEELGRLDDYVKEGLARPDVSPRDLPELEQLRDGAGRAALALRQARELRSQLGK